MRKLLFATVLTCLLVLGLSSVALAAHYGNSGDRVKNITAINCSECHAGVEQHTSGPHGGYTATTDKCRTCHDIHAGADNAQLLAGETLTDTCNQCHDLTATSDGPYNMAGIPQEMGIGSAHRVVGVDVYAYTDTQGTYKTPLLMEGEGITEIPGGNATDGGTGTLDITKQGKLSGAVFTCDSCHTPHGFTTVKPYLGESQVKRSTNNLESGVDFKLYMTTRLLKQKPNNVSTPVNEYGSAWCAACHKGRTSDLTAAHNHPVNDSGPAFAFLDLAYDKGQFNVGGTKTEALSNVTEDNVITVGTSGELKTDPRSNQQYALYRYDELKKVGESYFDRNTKDGYTDIANYASGPSCQQCHASARDVEDNFSAVVNPARNSFPHVSVNLGLLVESQDDFCTNCHGPAALP